MSRFNSVKTRSMKRSKFNLSYEKKMSANWSNLTPFYMEEVVPGDQFSVKSEALVRMAPMLAPLMHRVNVTTNYWFVPNRLVWDNWKEFISGGERGQDDSTFPRIAMNASNALHFQKGSLADYFGLPIVPLTGTTQGMYVSALPFRAYQMIYNEWYRNQSLQDPIAYGTGDDGEADITTITKLRTKNWEKDYFTSALPWAQKGDPVTAPIDLTYREPALFYTTPGQSLTDAGNIQSIADGRASHDTQGMVSIDNIEPESTGINVESLRTAVRLQEWLEKNARAGSRYIESILAHFGERVPDYTAQRPIFLGGGNQAVTISEVLQTSQTSDSGTSPVGTDSPQGNMAGHGISAGGGHKFKGKFTEHGYIIGVLSINPKSAYSQGIRRTWLRYDKFDFYWPEFAQLGEQEIYAQEVFAPFKEYGTTAPWDTFGYAARYDDMRHRQSEVSGDMRDDLSFWHLARQFANSPQLNSEFITANPRDDIFAVTEADKDKFWIQIYNNVSALRRMPKYNVPTL